MIPKNVPGLQLLDSAQASDASDDETSVEDEVKEDLGSRNATVQDLMDLRHFLEQSQKSMEERILSAIKSMEERILSAICSHPAPATPEASSGSNPVNTRRKRPYTGTDCTKPFKSPSRVIQTNDADPGKASTTNAKNSN
ncbi:hypothetical protein BGX26_009496 [Mortierella sp. AD094]|nr:hypothetical protein BGX26_009496 [Mortierella sp. AD094]